MSATTTTWRGGLSSKSVLSTDAPKGQLITPLVNFVKNMVDDVYVSKMDAKISHNREEFARGTAHRTTRKKHAPPKVARSNPCEMACARGMAALITQYCAQKKVAVTQSIHEKCVSTTPGKRATTMTAMAAMAAMAAVGCSTSWDRSWSAASWEEEEGGI
jgi:DhnA family fructose-bisphosphate aldolase class Ia